MAIETVYFDAESGHIDLICECGTIFPRSNFDYRPSKVIGLKQGLDSRCSRCKNQLYADNAAIGALLVTDDVVPLIYIVEMATGVKAKVAPTDYDWV